MKEAIISISFAILVLNAAIQLVAISKEVSVKTINYANSMNKAIDCAFLGLPIENCIQNNELNQFNETDLQGYINTLVNISSELSQYSK